MPIFMSVRRSPRIAKMKNNQHIGFFLDELLEQAAVLIGKQLRLELNDLQAICDYGICLLAAIL
ncbi:hypothetical protein [Picosynechococcus sp. PCC 7117]|uniref:hypothetical protein n=1 Tax=Picosynechococcus sp. PCC 7117 TaxID=195498 RepID=UPI0018DE5F81|nr:hypothetical protein [Picosynechococcus sp. PCC 7117]